MLNALEFGIYHLPQAADYSLYIWFGL